MENPRTIGPATRECVRRQAAPLKSASRQRSVDHCQHVCRYESPKVVKCCRVDSAFAPTSKIVVSEAATIRPEPGGETIRTVLVKCDYKFIWRIRSRMSTL